MNIAECKHFLKTEIEYQIGLKEKFLWLEIKELRYNVALGEVDQREFLIIAKMLKRGMWYIDERNLFRYNIFSDS